MLAATAPHRDSCGLLQLHIVQQHHPSPLYRGDPASQRLVNYVAAGFFGVPVVWERGRTSDGAGRGERNLVNCSVCVCRGICIVFSLLCNVLLSGLGLEGSQGIQGLVLGSGIGVLDRFGEQGRCERV